MPTSVLIKIDTFWNGNHVFVVIFLVFCFCFPLLKVVYRRKCLCINTGIICKLFNFISITR